MAIHVVRCPDWDLLHCFPLNDLLCQVADKCGNFGGETDLENTWMVLQSIQQLWSADVWEASSCTASN